MLCEPAEVEQALAWVNGRLESCHEDLDLSSLVAKEQSISTTRRNGCVALRNAPRRQWPSSATVKSCSWNLTSKAHSPHGAPLRPLVETCWFALRSLLRDSLWDRLSEEGSLP